MSEVINLTNFEGLPGQDGDVYRCKVGDVYSLKHAVGDLVAVVRTDRISAYDTILPNPIAHKGQVINEMSHALFEHGQADTTTLMSIPTILIIIEP